MQLLLAGLHHALGGHSKNAKAAASAGSFHSSTGSGHAAMDAAIANYPN
jgi:hypothetical protein